MSSDESQSENSDTISENSMKNDSSSPNEQDKSPAIEKSSIRKRSSSSSSSPSDGSRSRSVSLSSSGQSPDNNNTAESPSHRGRSSTSDSSTERSQISSKPQRQSKSRSGSASSPSSDEDHKSNTGELSLNEQKVSNKEKHVRSRNESGEDMGRNNGKVKLAPEDLFGDNWSVSSEASEDDAQIVNKSQVDKESDDNSPKSVARYEDDAASDASDEVRSKAGSVNEATEKEAETELIAETRIDVTVPKIMTDLGRELHFVKLPNFLSVESRPFDPETYEDEIEDEDGLFDDEGRSRLKLKVENTVRWRQSFAADGTAFRESNTRMVRWSDGSLSLHLGSEIFDVFKQPLNADFNHMFIRQGTGLQGQAVFRTKLTFRPHSTDSFTHQKMTRSMADRSNKATGIKVISQVGSDPEFHRRSRIREEEERLRANLRRDSRQKRSRETAPSRGLSSSYLESTDHRRDEDDSDDEEFSLEAIKRRHHVGRRSDTKKEQKPIYTSDEESDDKENSKSNRLENAKEMSSTTANNKIDDSDSNSHSGSSPNHKKEAKNAASDSPISSYNSSSSLSDASRNGASSGDSSD